ncbi:hypothetical protein BH10ACI2_BH10ACI2_12660 [soil metagenome]
MSQVEWQIVKDVFYQALNQPLTERSDFLDSKCGRSGPLRSEVEFLLESYESGFLETPILADKDQRTKDSPPLLELGREFRHYQILRLLGRGGMGEVYLADDKSLDRLVAIKIIHGDSGFGDQSAQRLIREARSAAKLDHPNICAVHEVGETDGMPYIAMQYVEGELLDTLLERNAVDFDDAVSYTRQIASALSKAHSRGVVHRDIKPSNAIVDSHKHLKVLDFGLAKETFATNDDINLSTAGLIAGTVAYMSPEHARGQEINGQTDIWSLGVVFYQMMTGRLPFRGETKADLIVSILNDEIAEAPEISKSARYVLDRALKKDCDLRYASVQELESDLAELAETGIVRSAHDFSSQTLVINTIPQVRFPVFKEYARPAVTLLLLMILAGGGYAFFRYRYDSAATVPFSAVLGDRIQSTEVFDQKQTENGAIVDLSFSPDGTKILFGMIENRSLVIYVKDLAGFDPIRLTPDNELNSSPIWSPDGQTIAYLTHRDHLMTLATIPVAGGEPTLLWRLENSWRTQLRKWSNDGTGMFFEGPNGLNRIEISTGVVTPIDLSDIEGKIASGIVLSPDESRALVKTNLGKNCKSWIKSLGIQDARQISEAIPCEEDPSWFPDGKRFVYASSRNGNGQLFVQNIDGSPPQQISSTNSALEDPVVSPEGDRIVLINNTHEGNIFSVDVRSLVETRLTSKTNMQALPVYSPDGLSFAYSSLDEPSQIPDGVLKIGSSGPAPSGLILPLDLSGCCVSWLPSGDAIAYLKESNETYTVWKYGFTDRVETKLSVNNVNFFGTTLTPLELGAAPIDFSPDGSKIVYAARSSGIDNIWIGSTDGLSEIKLTDYNDPYTGGINPLWSPISDKIAYVERATSKSSEASQENRIAFVENGRTVFTGVFKQRITILDWAKDGKGVFFFVPRNKSRDIYYQGVDDTKPQLCVSLVNARGIGIHISPDQKWVAFSTHQEDGENLFISPVNGGEARPVTKNLDKTIFYSGVTWSPDSNFLMYTKQTGGLRISMISKK